MTLTSTDIYSTRPTGNSRTTPDSQSSPLRAAEREMAHLLVSLSEALGKSCVYFAPDNMKFIEPPPSAPPILEQLDGRMRGLLAHTETVPIYEQRKEHLPEIVGDLYACAGGVRHAVELFRLLRIVKMPPFGIAPLLRMTDQAILLLTATATALEQDDPAAARSAMRAALQVRALCEEMQGIIADLSTFLPLKSWKMLKAASDSLMVAAEASARVAHRFASPLATKESPTNPTGQYATPVREKKKPTQALQTMPTAKKTGGFGALMETIRGLFGKK